MCTIGAVSIPVAVTTSGPLALQACAEMNTHSVGSIQAMLRRTAAWLSAPELQGPAAFVVVEAWDLDSVEVVTPQALRRAMRLVDADDGSSGPGVK